MTKINNYYTQETHFLCGCTIIRELTFVPVNNKLKLHSVLGTTATSNGKLVLVRPFNPFSPIALISLRTKHRIVPKITSEYRLFSAVNQRIAQFFAMEAS